MGAHFTNFQVRSESTDDVSGALQAIVKSPAYVSTPKDGWVTVYEKSADSQDDAIIRRIAMGLSRKLETNVLAFLVHDSDVLMYWLYDRGQLLDEFNSCPEYFGDEVDAETRERVRGDTDAVLALCPPGADRGELDEVLHPADGVFLGAEDTLQDLVKFLGIDVERALTGFRYFAEGEGADGFVAIGKHSTKSRRKTPKTTAAKSAAAAHEPFADVVSMLCNVWGPNSGFDIAAKASAAMGIDPSAIWAQVTKRFDKEAARAIATSQLADRPSLEELKAARDAGPEALADLICQRTPGQLSAVGARAAAMGYAQFLSALLDRGLDVNAKHESGMTLLMGCAQHGLSDLVSRLLSQGADPNARMYDNSTALICAARRNYPQTVERLLAGGADPSLAGSSGETALSVAAYHGKDSDVYRLLERATKPG